MILLCKGVICKRPVDDLTNLRIITVGSIDEENNIPGISSIYVHPDATRLMG